MTNAELVNAHNEGYNRGYAKAQAEIDQLKAQIEALETRCNELFFQVNEQIAQIEKMKVCSNCKHFNNVEDLEYCQNCERQLVNSLDKLPREEIIKDEWELKE